MSALEALLAKRERVRETVDIGEVFPTRDPESGPLDVTVQLLTKAEDYDARQGAIEMMKKYTAGVSDRVAEALTGEGMLDDFKDCEAMWRAYRDPADPERPAFPSVDFMMERLTNEDFGALLAIYNAIRASHHGKPWQITPEFVESLRDACNVLTSTTVPSAPLAKLDRDYLADVCLEAFKLWSADRRLLLDRIEQLEKAAQAE